MTATKAGASWLKAGAAPKVSSTKKKDDKPVLVDDSLEPLLKEWKDFRDAAESNTSLRDLTRERITTKVADFLFAECEKRKEAFSSCQILAGGMSVAYTQQNSYTIDGLCQDKLQETFGDNYSKYFLESLSVEIRPEALENEEFIETLRITFGDKFDEFFNRVIKIKATDAFHNTYMTDSNFRESVQALIDCKAIKPRAAYLTVK